MGRPAIPTSERPAAAAPRIEFTTDRWGRQRIEHDWPREYARCVAIQDALRRQVRTVDDFDYPKAVAGVDIGFEENGRITRAAVVVLDLADLTVIDRVLVRQDTRMPYIPGLLSFREVPAALAALDQLVHRPDLLLVDGHGIAHPRRLGVATHLGLASGLPSIGVAKKRLVGRHTMPAPRAGAWSELVDGDEVIGAVLRTRERVKPVFVSPGHRVGLSSAIAWTLRCCMGYRLPEATRQADRLASAR